MLSLKSKTFRDMVNVDYVLLCKALYRYLRAELVFGILNRSLEIVFLLWVLLWRMNTHPIIDQSMVILVLR
jgi:hypothetical protein